MSFIASLGYWADVAFGVAVLAVVVVALSRRRAKAAAAPDDEDRRRLFETSLDLIFITDRKGILLQVSPSVLATLGYAPAEMVGRSAREFIYEPDLEATRSEMRVARNGRATRNFDTRYVHKNGRVVTLAWSGVWSEAEQKHYFVGRDMTERNAAEEKLSYLAHFDPLTGLRNRVSVREDLDAMLGQARALALTLIDLDKFKDINDTLGHSIGDQLLKEVASRLTAAAQDREKVYRIGGDEFVVICADCGDPLVVVQSAEDKLKRLAEAFEIDGHRLFVAASAGIAIAPVHGAGAEDLMANADLALHDAKQGGGHTTRLFVPVLRAKAESRRRLDGELRRAFAENEFLLYYQPQVRLSDGAVTGVEALLRWQHPDRGILAPAAFIDALAESPAALDAGRWILQSACKQAMAWRAAGLPPLRIGVNLFPAQFHSRTLLEDVNAALAGSGLPAEALELEITENIALGHDEMVLAPLRALRAKGVSLAFDDFGTGYASLIYLRRYPLTRIKIDQSFIRKISDRTLPKDTVLTRSIITMAHNLGLDVVAEGVETPEQVAFLRGEKCEEVQGYLYARPLPAADFEAYLRGAAHGAPQASAADRRLVS